MILCGCTTVVDRLVAWGGGGQPPPPPPDGNQAEGREGWSGIRIVE